MECEVKLRKNIIFWWNRRYLEWNPHKFIIVENTVLAESVRLTFTYTGYCRSLLICVDFSESKRLVLLDLGWHFYLWKPLSLIKI